MQDKTKTKIIVTAIALAVLMILANYVSSEVFSIHGNLIKKIHIRDVLVKAEMVKTDAKKEKGLSGRDGLAEGRGMLFEMSGGSVQTFWMKGMRFPIDIIWIKNERVIGCEKNISPSDTRVFAPPSDAGYVLEVQAGFCDEHKVEVNDAFRL